MLTAVQLAEHPAVVFPAYLAALLPLTALYALDFITEKWKTVGHTRRTGNMYLFFSIPPLCFVVFYIHLQRIAQDFKEMAAATSAAIFCIFHILRTIWGLLQLDAFKQWNIRALRCLNAIGYMAPVYKPADESTGETARHAKISKEENIHVNGQQLEEEDTDRSPRGYTLRKPLKWLGKWVVLRARFFFAYIQLMYSSKYHAAGRSSQLSDRQLNLTVENHMVVNSSLIDNEFGSAELPCRLKFGPLLSSLWKSLRGRSKFRISDHLECLLPIECSVQWTVAFLARFGSEWLVKELSKVDGYASAASKAEQRQAICARVGVLAALQTTAYGNSCHFSTFRPGSSLFGSPIIQGVDLNSNEKIVLPYQCSGIDPAESVSFSGFQCTIRDGLAGWDRQSLNVLCTNQRRAVEQMTTTHVACFTKFMAMIVPKPSTVYNKPETAGRLHYGRSLYQMQIGCNINAMSINFAAVCPIPDYTFENHLWRGRFRNLFVLQTSAHIDNWSALESGRQFRRISDFEHSYATSNQNPLSVYELQKMMELRSYQYALSQDSSASSTGTWGVWFVGCVAESVRAFLAHGAATLETWNAASFNWRPAIRGSRLPFRCSEQLKSCLQKNQTITEMESLEDNWTPKTWSVETRLLWELQATLHGYVSEQAEEEDSFISLINSEALMMLLMLGYPSIELTQSSYLVPVDIELELSRMHSNGDEHLNICAHTEECECPSRFVCYSVVPVQGPQGLAVHIGVDLISGNGFATLSFLQEEEEIRLFDWQKWKDAYMGRVVGKSEWRTTRLGLTTEELREEAKHSILSAPMKSLHKGTRQWGGWPPFLLRISMISPKGQYGDERTLWSAERIERAMDAAAKSREPESGSRRILGAEPGVHERLLYGARASRSSGNFSKALALYGVCVRDYADNSALDEGMAILSENGSDFARDNINKLAFPLGDVLERILKSKKGKRDRLPISLEKACTSFESLIGVRRTESIVEKYARCLYELRDPRFIEKVEEDALQTWKYRAERQYLIAVFFLEQFSSTGDLFHRSIAENYLGRCGYENWNVQAAMSFAFLLEKGILRGRQSFYLQSLQHLGTEPSLSKENVGSLFLLPLVSAKSNMSRSADRYAGISRNVPGAVQVYERIVQYRRSANAVVQAGNRLGLIYFLGVGVPRDVNRAEQLWCDALHEKKKNKNTLCNLGTLQAYHYKKIEAAVEFLRSACEGAFTESDQESLKEIKHIKRSRPKDIRRDGTVYRIWPRSNICEDPHTTSLNNLAVLFEMPDNRAVDVAKALNLYNQIMRVDENPVALYNMTVLLKTGPSLFRNERRASEVLEKLIQKRQEIEYMHVLLRNIDSLKTWTVSLSTGKWIVELEEVDDCAGFVKKIVCRENFV